MTKQVGVHVLLRILVCVKIYNLLCSGLATFLSVFAWLEMQFYLYVKVNQI